MSHSLSPYYSSIERVVYTIDRRIGRVQYSEDQNLIFLTETARGTRHVYAVDLNEPCQKYTIYRHETEDFYENPGSLVTTGAIGSQRVNTRDLVQLSSDGRYVYFAGTHYSEDPFEEAPRPFIDRVEIRTGEKEGLVESARALYEEVNALLDP